MTTPLIARHVLPGLRPEPLASYLAGLGLIRVLGEQADPAATAAWTPDGLAIGTTVPDIAAWLMEEYVPTPVLSPWNGGSGFGAKDKEPVRRFARLREHPSPRLAQLREAISVAEAVVARARDRGWITETGVARRDWPWQPKISRAVTSFIEASGVKPAVSGGVKRDVVINEAKGGATALTPDPFLTVSRDDDLLVRWEASLDDERPDEYWWRPDTTAGPNRTRLLAVARPVSRRVLEATTDGIRGQRRTMPPGTRWVSYAAGDIAPQPEREDRAAAEHANVTVIRFAVMGCAPLLATHGVLLADEAHRQVGKLLEKAGIPDERRQEIMGTRGAASDHRHAHWIPAGGAGESAAYVRNLIVWMPDGLRTAEVRAILSLRSMSGQRGGEDGYELRGFPKVEVLFQAAGRVADVTPELCGPAARRWRSRTPYLPVRHRKSRESAEEYLAADVAAELRYRGRADVTVASVELSSGMPARTVNQFRRYRTKERLRRSRPGVGLVLEFTSPVRCCSASSATSASAYSSRRRRSSPSRRPRRWSG